MLNRKFLVCNPIISTEDYSKVIYLFTEIAEDGRCRNWFKSVIANGDSLDTKNLHDAVDFAGLSAHELEEYVALEQIEELDGLCESHVQVGG